MASILHLDPASRPRSASGKAMPYATLTFLRSRTDIVLATYTADSAGDFATITPDFATYTYRVQLRDQFGVLRYDVDPYKPAFANYVDAQSNRLSGGEIIPNAECLFRDRATPTPNIIDIFADADLTIPLPNPIKTDSSGLLPPIYKEPGEYNMGIGGGGADFDGELYPPAFAPGGTVVFNAADISGAGGTTPRGYNSATATDWIGNPTTCLAAGTYVSGNIAGETDIGIGTFVGSGNELSVRIRIASGDAPATPQTYYFTGLSVSGSIESGLTAAGATFTTDTTSDPGFITYEWGWIMIDNLMQDGVQYSAVFT